MTRLQVLAGKTVIEAAERRILGLACQPDEDFPDPSGNHQPIGGRS